MFIVSEEWKAAYPAASAGLLVMRGLCNPARHPALEARRLQVEGALRGRFGSMDRAQLVSTAPLDAYSVYFKRFKKIFLLPLPGCLPDRPGLESLFAASGAGKEDDALLELAHSSIRP